MFFARSGLKKWNAFQLYSEYCEVIILSDENRYHPHERERPSSPPTNIYIYSHRFISHSVRVAVICGPSNHNAFRIHFFWEEILYESNVVQ